MIKITADKELFDKFKFLSIILLTMGSIVQNDTEITEKEFEDYKVSMDSIINQLKELSQDIEQYVDYTNYKGE